MLRLGRDFDFASALFLFAWLAYFTVTTTSGIGWLTTWHNEQRATQVVLLAGTALVAPLYARRLVAGIYSLRISGACLCFLVLFALSVGTASYPAHSLAEGALLVSLIGLVVVVWLGVSKLPFRFVYWAAVFLGAAHVTGVLTRYATAVSLSQPLGLDVLLLGYANPRFPSALYAVLIPFLASAAATPGERRLLQVLAFVVLSALWSINLALATRAILFSFIVAAPLFLLLVGSAKARSILFALFASFVIGALLYWLMFFLVPMWAGLSTVDLARSKEDLSGTSGRVSLWGKAAELIVANPIFGIGPMHFASVSHPNGAHPHNAILQLASEYGAPATLVFGYVVWKLVQNSASTIRRYEASKAHNCVPAFLAVIVAVVYSLVDGNYLMPVSQSAIAVSVGILLAGTSPLGAYGTGPMHFSPWVARLAGVLVTVSGIYLAAYAAATVGAGTPTAGAYSLPRFWEQGLIGPINGVTVR